MMAERLLICKLCINFIFFVIIELTQILRSSHLNFREVLNHLETITALALGGG